MADLELLMSLVIHCEGPEDKACSVCGNNTHPNLKKDSIGTCPHCKMVVDCRAKVRMASPHCATSYFLPSNNDRPMIIGAVDSKARQAEKFEAKCFTHSLTQETRASGR